MPVYFEWGNRPNAPVNQTATCNNCVETLGRLPEEDLIYDTERDAWVTYNKFGQLIVVGMVRLVWTDIWNKFTCTNGDCQHKAPCGSGATWIQLGTQAVPNAAGDIVWQFYIELAREIQCVPDAGAQDTTPEIPMPQLPAPRQTPPAPEPDETEPMKFEDEMTGLVIRGTTHLWSVGSPGDGDKGGAGKQSKGRPAKKK